MLVWVRWVRWVRRLRQRLCDERELSGSRRSWQQRIAQVRARLEEEQQLATKLRAEYTSWRLTRSMRMRFNSKVQSVLEEGLALLEQARCSSSSTAQMEVDKWRGRLMAATPPDHRFRGRALTFSTTDVDEIVEHIMTTYPYHEEGHRDATFAIAVATFPHYCAAPRRTTCCSRTQHRLILAAAIGARTALVSGRRL